MNIADLRVGDQYEGFLRVKSARVLPDRLTMKLADITGQIDCIQWKPDGEAPEEYSVIKVRGVINTYNDKLQLRMEKWRSANENDPVDEKLLPPVEVVRTVSQCQPGKLFKGHLLVRASAQREGKNSRYLDLNLVDRTGEINCKVWNGTIPPPKVSCVVYVEGQVEEYNSRLQMRINKIEEVADISKIDMRALIPCAPDTPEHMRQIIEDTIDRFESDELKKLVREALRMAGASLDWFPAAQRMHHAERSGLLHHTTDMLKLAEALIVSYPYLNGDLLRAGVILHDLAKIQEMVSDENGNVSDYSRDGLLVGHLVRGVSRLDEAARNVGVSGEMVALLEHMIISHHGVPEYGSPRMPMTPEAEALHWIDTLDARMNEFQGIVDRTPAGAFSERIASLDGRRIYHAFYTDQAE